MEQLSDDFTRRTGIRLDFVVLPENELRQKVTEDVGLGSGKYDVVTIGTYDTPIWGRNRWVLSLEPFFARMPQAERDAYARDDLLPSIRAALVVRKRPVRPALLRRVEHDVLPHGPLRKGRHRDAGEADVAADLQLRGAAAGQGARLLRDRAAGPAGLGRDPRPVRHRGQRLRRAMVRPAVAARLQRAGHEGGVGVLQAHPGRRGGTEPDDKRIHGMPGNHAERQGRDVVRRNGVGRAPWRPGIPR